FGGFGDYTKGPASSSPTQPSRTTLPPQVITPGLGTTSPVNPPPVIQPLVLPAGPSLVARPTVALAGTGGASGSDSSTSLPSAGGYINPSALYGLPTGGGNSL